MNTGAGEPDAWGTVVDDTAATMCVNDLVCYRQVNLTAVGIPEDSEAKYWHPTQWDYK